MVDDAVSHLIPEAIRSAEPYQSARRIGNAGHLYLNANELASPMPYDVTPEGLHRYPDFKPQAIASAYADYANFRQHCIATRGADEAIELLVRTFCEPKRDSIARLTPTYGMYEICAQLQYVGCDAIPLGDDGRLDVERFLLLPAKCKLIFLCNPNNPTGTKLNRQDLVALLKATQGKQIVVIDEAYIEFCPAESSVPLLEQFPHLAIIRTLSKAFGLAAARCGFLLGSQAIVEAVQKTIAPYPIPDVTADVVLGALSESGVVAMQARVDDIIRQRDQLIEVLSALPFVISVWSSDTNFVLLRAENGPKLFQHLLTHGIVCRDQSHDAALADCIRITVGSADDTAELISTLHQYPRSL